MKYLKGDLLLLAAFLSWAAASFISNSLLSVHHVLLVLAIGVTLRERPQFLWQKSTLCLVALIAILCLSVVFNWETLDKPWSKLFKIRYLFFAVSASLLMTYQRDRLKGNLSRIVLYFLFSFLISVVYGLLRYYKLYLFDGVTTYRPTGFFGIIMSYAYTAIWPVLLVVHLALNPQINIGNFNRYFAFIDKSWFRYLMVSAAVLTLYLAQARGALLGFLLALPFLFLWNNKRNFLIVSSGVVLVLTFAFWNVVHAKKIENSQNLLIFQSKDSDSNQIRLSQFEMAWHGFLEKPLLGQGWRSLEEKSLEIKKRSEIAHLEFAGHAHNNFLEVLGASGIFALVMFLAWLFFWILEILFRMSPEWRPFYFAGVVGFIVSGLFQSTFIDSEYAFTLFALYGLTPLFSSPRG